MPSNPRKHKIRANLNRHTRRIAEQACEHVLETWELPGASGSQPKCGGHGGDDHACAPAPDLATAHVTGFVADLALRGLGPLVTSEHAPPPSQQPTQWQCIGADGDASDKVEKLAATSAMANPLRSATAEVLERKCGSHGGGDHACAPAPALATAHVHGLVANELRGPMESGVMGDASTEGDSATGGASTRAPCKYTRANVRGRWLELRDRLRVDAPLPLEWPSSTIPETALATMKRGPPKYADFAKSVPPQNPFTPASAHGGTSQSNISQCNNGCSGSHYYSQPNSVSNITHNYNYSCASAPAATAPAAAPAATAPPSSKAQQLADVKDMFEQGLIPSRKIYEDKVRHILGLS